MRQTYSYNLCLLLGCLVDGRVTDPSRLYTEQPSITDRNISEKPLVPIEANIDIILRLFNPSGRGLSFTQLMSQVGQCADCGRCFGVSLLRREAFILHICPNRDQRHSLVTRSPHRGASPPFPPSPSPPLIFESVDGVFVEEGVLHPRSPQPVAGPSTVGPTRSPSIHSSRYHPICRDVPFSPVTRNTPTRRNRKRLLTPDFDLTRDSPEI